VAAQVQDDGFHEIQLNGKQLVFLFMAATVVSVVIFLCGVLVGRGVRAERNGSDVAGNAAPETMATTPQQPAPPAAATTGSDPTTAAPPPTAADDLSYFNRLEKQNAPPEQLKPAGEKPAQRAAPAATNAEPPPAPAPAPSADASPEPGGPGYAVQIAALNVRSEAEAIAKRLSSKGYSAYVLAPASGTPAVYRVRVGKFPTRREADAMAARLKRDEQFNPWVTR
jgi:cell division septation protein DedD